MLKDSNQEKLTKTFNFLMCRKSIVHKEFLNIFSESESLCIDVLHMVYTWKNHLCSTKVIHNVVFCGKYINLPSMSMENVWNTLVTWVSSCLNFWKLLFGLL
ncbi:hypothetical protein ACKWTF_006516 [Chironomus riparius]